MTSQNHINHPNAFKQDPTLPHTRHSPSNCQACHRKAPHFRLKKFRIYVRTDTHLVTEVQGGVFTDNSLNTFGKKLK